MARAETRRQSTYPPRDSPAPGVSQESGESTAAGGLLAERLLAGGFELVARGPAGELVGVGDEDADTEAEPDVIDHAVEVPVRPDLIARLVVARLLERLDLLAAPAGRAVDEVGAGVEVEAGDADAGEAELVGAVERAAVGELIRLDGAALAPGELLERAVEGGLALADVGDVAGLAPDVAAVEVDVGGDLAGGDARVGGVVQRAEQALLLAGDE